jgi:predicted nucleotide-binding protein
MLRVPEPGFTALAGRHPRLWRALAHDLSERMRQRDRLVRHRNRRPRLLLGSSAAALPIAREIQAGLAADSIVAKLWTDRVFDASSFILDSLQSVMETMDFAVVLLAPDDLAAAGGEVPAALRDDLIFQLGVFVGSLGRERVALVVPQGAGTGIPVELLETPPIELAAGDPAAGMAALCAALSALIRVSGPR